MKNWKKGIKVLAILLALTLTLTATLAGCAKKEPEKESILIGYVAPFTGPLSSFTVSVRLIADEALAEINKDGGIFITEYNKRIPVEVIWGDSESDPTKAAEVATKFVLEDKVDILVGAWTPATINPVSAVAERNQVPALMENGPLQSWMEGGPYTWAFGHVFDAYHLFIEAVASWSHIETNKKVGMLFDNDVDGVLFNVIVRELAEAQGFTVFDPGRYPAGTPDYTALIAQLQQEDCDIVIGNMILPDFLTCWNQLLQSGYMPKIFNIGKGLHFNAEADAIGPTALGLTSEVMWNPTFNYVSPLTGQNSAQQGANFSAATGQPPSTSIGYDWATFETIWDVMNRAQTLDKEAIRQAFAATDLETSYGRIKYENNICLVPVVAGQWDHDETWGWKTNVISATTFPRIPSHPELMFPMPGSN